MRNIILLSVLLTFIGCDVQKKSVLEQFTTNDILKIFEKENTKGCFIIQDFKNNKSLSYNSVRLDSVFLPASTFKIINSMIALETEVIKDENEIIKWDGKKRFINEWNRDHNLKSGIKYSVVWLYQELARRIGEDRMLHWVKTANYGNKNIGGNIDTFWLNGEIRISANQQIDFLKRLYLKELPFSKQNQEIVKDIMIVEKKPNYTIRAKTGWAARVERQIGWYVGYIEKNDNVYFFALNMDIKSKQDAAKRKLITKQITDLLYLTK